MGETGAHFYSTLHIIPHTKAMFALPFPWLPVPQCFLSATTFLILGLTSYLSTWPYLQKISDIINNFLLHQVTASGKTLLALTWLSWLSCLKWYFRQIKDNLRQLRHLSQVKARSVFPDGIGLGHCWFHILYWDDTQTCSHIHTLTFPLSLSLVTFPFWPILFHWLIIINRFLGMDSSSLFASAAHSGRGREHFKLPQRSHF